jgi:hypothetical protein
MMSGKDKGTVELDPEYATRIAAVKVPGPPLGGAPMPSIPRLDQQPGDRHAGVQAAAQRAAMVTPEQRAKLESEGRFVPGVGSGFAANQPGLRAEEPAPTIANPPRPEGGLRQETLDGLAAVAEANRTAPPPEVTEEVLDKEVSKIEDDEFDYGEFGRRVRSLLLNKERRLAIEKRIVDLLDIEQLLVHQELRQEVPIIPGKFSPTFRSISGHEDLWAKRMINTETGSETYIMDKFAMMNLCLGLHSLNRRPLLAHLDKDGLVDDKLFSSKFNQMLRYPLIVLADLSVNYTWFGKRLERLLVVDDIKSF